MITENKIKQQVLNKYTMAYICSSGLFPAIDKSVVLLIGSLTSIGLIGFIHQKFHLEINSKNDKGSKPKIFQVIQVCLPAEIFIALLPGGKLPGKGCC